MIRCDRLIFGGSFDPPHRGHLAILRYVLEFDLAPVIDLVPAAVSPFKTDAPPTAGPDRRRLLEAALADLADDADLIPTDDAQIDDSNSMPQTSDSATKPRDERRPIDIARIHLRTLELERPPPSYTADTCADLQRAHPGQTLGLLIGSDSLHDFERWHRVADILAGHPVLVFRRAGDTPEGIGAIIRELTRRFADPGGRRAPLLIALPNPMFPCASSDIRSLTAGDNLDHCLTPRVARLIQELQLY